MGDGIRRVDAAQAAQLQCDLGAAVPATLHPVYLVADAAREPSLSPAWICFESGGQVWLHGVHLARIDGTPWSDASSPYGYGGPLASTRDPAFVAAAWTAYAGWMRAQGVVAEYVRFHPLLGNDVAYGGQVLPNREVVSVDLAVPDLQRAYAARVRQTVQRAERAALTYEELPLARCALDFGAFHQKAMRAMGTDPFYVWGDAYFDALAAVPGATLAICRAQGGLEWLAAAVFLDGGKVREYHLAGATDAGRRAGASAFVLHRGALAARDQGLGQLYLGGGSDTRPDNPLLFFKSGFSPTRLPYRTGFAVFDETARNALKARFPQAWAAHPERPIFWRKV